MLDQAYPFVSHKFRGMYLTRIKEQKEARAQCKRLHPSTEFLFGGQVKELSKDIRAAEELDPLAPPPAKKFFGQAHGSRGGAGGQFTKFTRGRGSFGGYGSRGSGPTRGPKRGSGRGISKFKE